MMVVNVSAKADAADNSDTVKQANTQTPTNVQDNSVTLKEASQGTQQTAKEPSSNDDQTITKQAAETADNSGHPQGQQGATNDATSDQPATTPEKSDSAATTDVTASDTLIADSQTQVKSKWPNELAQATKIEQESSGFAPTADESLPMAQLDVFHSMDAQTGAKLVDDYIKTLLSSGQTEANYLKSLGKSTVLSDTYYDYIKAQFPDNPAVVATIDDLKALQKTEMTPIVDPTTQITWTPYLIPGETAEQWMYGATALGGPTAMQQLGPVFIGSTPASYMFLNNIVAAIGSGTNSASAGFPGHASVPPENSEIDAPLVLHELPMRVYIPTQPTQPTEPNKPNQPTQPTTPTTPRQPSQPTEPTQPSQPSQPTQPFQPSQPTQPTQPNQSSEPGKPVPPAEPSTPGVPSKTLVPGTPPYHQVVTKRTTTTSQKVVAQKLPQTSENERQNSGTVLAGLAGLMAMLGMAWKKRKS
ncbi:LPXTG cell wall anchor domain-containing protein [Secundilactobacillus mixtipabuli]|uniref:Signal peptide, KxYKxGKxW domain-containing protein n=1 Tax=Secundilactobacillus mixtipabuli TaxID=1435342 RepID=A0A1Z5IBV7_9LACO|nr:LPXTG cell wall anchor domain-containing protein [Secundilactobacillus mixtipabuli]GAW99204.1 signal peptide, KxYKxGKxW domain-containing protein [Secundilactobacillus mixtipabuli]